jgi:hypothetical protein
MQMILYIANVGMYEKYSMTYVYIRMTSKKSMAFML